MPATLPGETRPQYLFLQKVYVFRVILLFMAKAQTHPVVVKQYKRDVPVTYKGTDPRTKAAHKEKH